VLGARGSTSTVRRSARPASRRTCRSSPAGCGCVRSATAPAAAGRRGGRDVTGDAARPGHRPAFAGTAGTLVKQPVEWLVGAVRQLGIDLAELPRSNARVLARCGRWARCRSGRPAWAAGRPGGLADHLVGAGPAQAGQALAALAPAAVETRSARGDRLDALARMLVVDGWTDRTGPR
jgi:hypothetical protein